MLSEGRRGCFNFSYISRQNFQLWSKIFTFLEYFSPIRLSTSNKNHIWRGEGSSSHSPTSELPQIASYRLRKSFDRNFHKFSNISIDKSIRIIMKFFAGLPRIMLFSAKNTSPPGLIKR